MFENEVNYRLAKWLLANLKAEEIISDGEMHKALEKVAEYYNPPFLEVENMDSTIGDGVIVDER